MSVKKSAKAASQPVLVFADAAGLERWLEKHHSEHPGIWLKIAKKGAGLRSVTYAEALDIALCHGWIDGQKQSCDEKTFLQKFTRRGPRSIWSKINVGHVERLTREGRMKPSGYAAVVAAKADGRWERAYASGRAAELPPEFKRALAKHPKAKAFFATLNKTNCFSIYFRLHTAKRPETRARRLEQIIAMLDRGEKFH